MPLTLPAALTSPPVKTLPLVTLPVADTFPAVNKLPPWTSAVIIADVALIMPVDTLLEVALPVTFKLLPIIL